MLLSSVDFNCSVITANRCWEGGGGVGGLDALEPRSGIAVGKVASEIN